MRTVASFDGDILTGKMNPCVPARYPFLEPTCLSVVGLMECIETVREDSEFHNGPHGFLAYFLLASLTFFWIYYVDSC